MKSHLLDFINRWRHTLGYGVHSPLAFRIVKECVHPDIRYAYYADSVVQSYSENAEMYRQLRLMIRLVNTLHLKDVWMPGCPEIVLKIMRKAYPSLRIFTGTKSPQSPDFIVLFSAPSDDIVSQLPSDSETFTILSFHQHNNSKLHIKNSKLILQSSSFTLYISRLSMCPVSYTLL